MGTAKMGMYLGHTLVKQEVITEGQFKLAKDTLKDESELSNRRLGQVLYQDLGLERDHIMKGIANSYAIREVYEEQEKIGSEEIERIQSLELPESMLNELMRLKAIPIDKTHDSVTVATSDPTDSKVIEIVENLNFRNFELVYCRDELIKQVLEEVYEQKNDFLDLLEEIEYEEPDLSETNGDKKKIDEEEIKAEINRSKLNSLVEGFLVEAVRKGVSDIHIIPSGITSTNICFRIDGKLELWHQQKNVKPEAISAVVKDKARNVDRFERDASQDGFIQRQVDNHSIRYRVSIMPMVGKEYDRKFESIVIRVLDDRKVITDLNVLGLQEKAKEDFVKAIEKPSGIVIITGPTGSGKSTTLVAALYSVVDPTVNVLTVEEPVEYLIEGARQLKLSNNMTFDNAMRGILRHDPDIVLVGEIRDLKTAEIAIKLANTGHLTFSTLHTNDAPSAISRLYKMGVEPFLIANAVNLIMAQRLVRKLCDNCKQQYDPHLEMAKGIGFAEEEIESTIFYRANGCEECTNGYKGRTAIMEALYFDAQIRKMILESGEEINEAAIKEYAMSQGMLSLRASGRERIKNGTTTIEEVAAITIEDESGKEKSISDYLPSTNKNKQGNQNGEDQAEILSERRIRKLASALEQQLNINSNGMSEPARNGAAEFHSDKNGSHHHQDAQMIQDYHSHEKLAVEGAPHAINSTNNSSLQQDELLGQLHKLNTMDKKRNNGNLNGMDQFDEDKHAKFHSAKNDSHHHQDAPTTENEAGNEKPISDEPSNAVNEKNDGRFRQDERATDLPADKINKSNPWAEESDEDGSNEVKEASEEHTAEFSVDRDSIQHEDNFRENENEEQFLANEKDIAEKRMKPLRSFMEYPPKFLEDFPKEDTMEFLRCGTLKRYARNEVILQANGYVNSAYLVVEGEVAIWQDDIQLAALSRGSTICETFLFSKNTQITKAVSVSESTLLQFERHTLLNFFRKNPHLFTIFAQNTIQHNNVN